MKTLMVLMVTLARAGEHEEHEHEEHEGDVVAPVSDPAWASECGSCHLAYPPGLLPARSWSALLSDLGHHFGDDASVDPAVLARLRQYAEAQAADRQPASLSRWITRASAGTTPLRISEIPALRAEHLEEVRTPPKSWASCASCHTGAAAGRF
jgi:hypothetical protein